MNEFATAFSATADTARAAAEIVDALRATMRGAVPDAIVVFASANHDADTLLAELRQRSGCHTIAGASSAGEFINTTRGEGAVSALAFRSDRMHFSVGLGKGVRADVRSAARQATAAFNGAASARLPHRAALVMTDALAGHADALVEELTLQTGGNYRFFGGGAGDDGLFRQTKVFAGAEAATDAVCVLEILSERPLGIGVAHGWLPASEPMRVTESAGSRLVGLNGLPAADVVETYAAQAGARLDRKDPMPFFLHNILGIRTGDQYRLRVPLGIDDQGAILCAADVPEGSIVHVMKTSAASAVDAATRATRAALEALGGSDPGAALVFDCVATRLRMGAEFRDELSACARLLQPAELAGCNTYGQIARAEGQFGGFHNCTAVVCALPK